jgi:hypothetical protein
MKRIERILFVVNGMQPLVAGCVGSASGSGAIRAVSGSYPQNAHVLFDALRVRV